MGRMWTALQPGTSSKVAIDGPFEAVLGKTHRTEFSRGKGKPEARSSPPGAPSLLGSSSFLPEKTNRHRITRKDELTSRQESSGKGDSWKLETFQMEPCG